MDKDPVQKYTKKKKEEKKSVAAQVIRKKKGPEVLKQNLLRIELLQPWEEKMGLLMLLLVVMAASSHLISCGSPDCSRLY